MGRYVAGYHIHNFLCAKKPWRNNSLCYIDEKNRTCIYIFSRMKRWFFMGLSFRFINFWDFSLDMQNGKFKIKCSFSQKFLRNWKSCTEWLEMLDTYLKLVVKFRYSEKVTIIRKNLPLCFTLRKSVKVF